MQTNKDLYVCVYASQVAMCIGANRHKKLGDAAELMWKRISPDTYDRALHRNGIKTDEENVEELVQSNTIVSKLVQQSLMECTSSDDVAKHYGTAIQELHNSSDLDGTAKQLVEDAIKKNLYTTYGNHNEPVIMTYINRVLGIACNTDPTFYKKLMGNINGTPWYIGGKIDGISENGKTVIEIKNRINRLFMRQIPIYEKIQVQTYLDLLDVPHGLLIECFTPQNGSVTSNIVPMARDAGMWNDDIVPKLKQFITFILKLIEDHKLQDKFLLSKRRSSLVKHMLTPYYT